MLQSAYSEPSESETFNETFNTLKSEFVLFMNTGERTQNLQKLFDALLSIKPTSTDVERVFSSATFFCTKLCSRLSDDALNALIFHVIFLNCITSI